MDDLAVEICRMPCVAGVWDPRNFEEIVKLWSVVDVGGRAVACGLCPAATAFGGVELFSFVSILDAAWKGRSSTAMSAAGFGFWEEARKYGPTRG